MANCLIETFKYVKDTKIFVTGRDHMIVVSEIEVPPIEKCLGTKISSTFAKEESMVEAAVFCEESRSVIENESPHHFFSCMTLWPPSRF